MKYVALLRGVNVGGKNRLPMAELRSRLDTAGFESVKTYIQSGNVIFESSSQSDGVVAEEIESIITKQFGLSIPVVVLSQYQFEAVASNTPDNWLQSKEYKYNYIFLQPPYDMAEVIGMVGDLKTDIESITAGNGVLYQSMSIKYIGRTTFSKIVGKPIYKQMTIRNHNTVTKILELLRT